MCVFLEVEGKNVCIYIYIYIERERERETSIRACAMHRQTDLL